MGWSQMDSHNFTSVVWVKAATGTGTKMYCSAGIIVVVTMNIVLYSNVM